MKKYLKVMLVGLVVVVNVNCGTNNKEIMNSIKASCNCEEIVEGISSNGITFSKRGKSSIGERHEIFLKKCEFSDYKIKTKEIAAKLQEEGMCKDILIVMNFENEDGLEKELYIENCQVVEVD